MSKIHLLNSLTANQIAAGEVIERPVSVVKELVENSLDAGASKIVVEINNGGLTLIKVTDNGCGMADDDLMMAVKRHATSKLQIISDLEQLQSLGFRGEALPSIVSVAQVEIISRQPENNLGQKMVVSGDSSPQFEPIGAPVGTSIKIAELFYNTPARKKFLRSEGYESSLIHELLTKFSLSHPQVTFCLWRDGKEILNTAGMNTHPDLLEHYFGYEAREALIEVSGELPGGHINGFLTLPTYHRMNRKGINFFINHRRVYVKELMKALEEAYEDTLPKGQFPLCVLNLALDPVTIDVNVHPSKMEVRLRNPLLAKEMRTLLRQHLIARKKIPHYLVEIAASKADNLSVNEDVPLKPMPKTMQSQDRQTELIFQQTSELKSTTPASNKPSIKPSIDMTVFFEADEVSPIFDSDNKDHETISEPRLPCQNFSAKAEPPEAEALQQLRIIGQLSDTFILAEGKEGLYLIDQHIAHERVIFEEFLSKAAVGSLDSQVLLQPITLHLSLLEEESVLKYILPLVDLGIILEHFGPRTYLLRAIPSGIKIEPQDYFYSLLENLENSQGKTDIHELKKEFLIHASCKAAIKAHTKLTLPQMEQLLRDLGKTKNYLTCPHGRPIIYKITHQEILKAFHRL